MTEIKQLIRWAVMVYSDKGWMMVNEDGKLSLHHLPKTWFNREEAEKEAEKYKGANIIKWEGR
jgi:hypothetical protein